MDSQCASRPLLAQMEPYLLPVPVLLGLWARESISLSTRGSRKPIRQRGDCGGWGVRGAELRVAHMARRKVAGPARAGEGVGLEWAPSKVKGCSIMFGSLAGAGLKNVRASGKWRICKSS